MNAMCVKPKDVFIIHTVTIPAFRGPDLRRDCLDDS